MVKRWLSTFVEQPSPAALQVVAERLGERMRCSHGLGHQRGGARRIGACSSRTGADGDRMQRASISSHRVVRTNNMECMCQHWSAAACASCCGDCKLKDHLFLERSKLFSRGLDCCTADSGGRAMVRVPSSGVGRCVPADQFPEEATAQRQAIASGQLPMRRQRRRRRGNEISRRSGSALALHDEQSARIATDG